MNLKEKRDALLDKISFKYDFWHSSVESYSGWKQTQLGNEFTQEVIIQKENCDTEIIKLFVIFKNNSDEIESVYAYDDEGNNFGGYAPE